MSVGQVVNKKKESNVTFSKSGCVVQDLRTGATGKLIGRGRKAGRLFHLEFCHHPPTTSLAAADIGPPFSASQLWHQRASGTDFCLSSSSSCKVRVFR